VVVDTVEGVLNLAHCGGGVMIKRGSFTGGARGVRVVRGVSVLCYGKYVWRGGAAIGACLGRGGVGCDTHK
jgi:hypothetical protein